MTRPTLDPNTDIPDHETPEARCPYCERPFRSAHACALHLGEEHEGDCTDDETEAYEEAREAERDELFYFQLKVVIALGLIYGGTVLVYTVALGSGLL